MKIFLYSLIINLPHRICLWIGSLCRCSTLLRVMAVSKFVWPSFSTYFQKIRRIDHTCAIVFVDLIKFYLLSMEWSTYLIYYSNGTGNFFALLFCIILHRNINLQLIGNCNPINNAYASTLWGDCNDAADVCVCIFFSIQFSVIIKL